MDISSNKSDQSKSSNIPAELPNQSTSNAITTTDVAGYTFIQQQGSNKYEAFFNDGKLSKNITSAMPLKDMKILFKDLDSLHQQLNKISVSLVNNTIKIKEGISQSKELIDNFYKAHINNKIEIIDNLPIQQENIDETEFKTEIASICKNLTNFIQEFKKSSANASIFKKIFIAFKNFCIKIYNWFASFVTKKQALIQKKMVILVLMMIIL